MNNHLNLFVDTNVFLSFYSMTNEDLEELKKLTQLLDKGAVKLYLSRQVVDEFTRNRPFRVHEALKK